MHPKTGLPYHPMLDYFRDGLHIISFSGDASPNEDQLTAFESKVKWQLPSAYRDFLRKFGAIYYEATDRVWPNAQTGSVRPFWATNYGFIIFGFGKSIEEWMSVERKVSQFQETFPDLPFFIPIHRRVAGDQTYIGFDSDGQLVTAFPSDNKLEPLGVLFDEFVRAEAEDLAHRTTRMIEYTQTGKWPQ